MHTLKLNNVQYLLSVAVASKSNDLDVCVALRIISMAASIISKLSVRSVIVSGSLAVNLVGKSSQDTKTSITLTLFPYQRTTS